MARQDIAGLLTGMPSKRPDPMGMGVNSEQQRLAFGAQRAQGMERGLRSAMGQGPTTAEKLQMAMADLDLNKTEDLKKLASIMQASGDFAGAAKIASTIGDRRKSQLRRDSLITQAKKLNLEDTADLLVGGGPLELAEKQILEAEERNIVSKQGRKGRAAVAGSKGAGDAVIQAIMKGEYDNISDSLFLEQMSGEKAELKTFKQVVDGKEIVRPFRINESGKVYNSSTEKWVNPVDLGLTQAPQVTKDISEANTFSAKLTKGAADNFLELNEAARTAEEILTLNSRSKVLMDEGIKTGFGANFRLNTARLAKELGLVPKSMDDIAASEEFIAIRARQLMKLLPAFGSGSGISDRDVDIARGIAGGDVSLDEEALRRILYMEETLARDLIAKNNKSLERMIKITGEEMSPAIAEGFYVPLPRREDYVIPPNAARYLQE
jgi:hypothetical protein